MNEKTVVQPERTCQARLSRHPVLAPDPGPEWYTHSRRTASVGCPVRDTPRRGPLGYVSISKRGSVVESGIRVKAACQKSHQRGAITGFSVKSCRRLRRLLIEWEGTRPGYEIKGLSLTVPGPCVVPSEWRRLFQMWRDRLNDAGVVAIWRVELQRRKQPHIHAVVWEREASACAWRSWYDVLLKSGPVRIGEVEIESRGHLPGATEHAAKVDYLNERDPIGWYRYLACHASKKKQAQLGWEGRQWGVIGRNLLTRSAVERHEMSAKEILRVNRVLRKLVGMKRVSRHGAMSWFVKPESMKQIVRWAKGMSAGEVSREGRKSLATQEVSITAGRES